MHRYLSTYQIFRGKSGEMAYKNVHKIVKHLHSLNLIEIVGRKSIGKERESIHNPKYYRLTTGGIFSLIYNDQFSLQFPGMEKIKNLFQNYSENIIFRTILYPYFEEQSLSLMDSSMIIEEILDYLNKCCAITNTFIESINKNKWASYLEAALSGLALHINYNLLTLVFSINLRITEKEGLLGTEIKTNSFNILSKDRKFVSLLERTKKLFEERYQEFMQLKTV
jgi:hypothetical protein